MRRRSLSQRRARRSTRLLERDADAYAFLIDIVVDAQTLDRAIRLAYRWQTMPHVVLFALGWAGREPYARALARHLGLPLGEESGVDTLSPRMLDAADFRPDEVALIARSEAAAGHVIAVTWGPPRARRTDADAALAKATSGLKRRRPDQSAGLPTWQWQRMSAAVAVGTLAGGLAVAPREACALLMALLAFPFVLVTGLRALALFHLCLPHRPSRPVSTPESESGLPYYSVLVPLYDETRVVEDLVAALSEIDYPLEKLEVLIVIESGDLKMRSFLDAMVLPAHFEVLVVPQGQPRTKPRALNFALQFARGEFVVVYDAEDVPEPDQIRLAVHKLRERPEVLGCVQARLNIYNPRASWLSRQFTIEYSALFDGLLPTLERFGLPVPLGGTSNHFPRPLIEALGAWDPYNVTEDADLGIRLARRGWRVAMIDSTTWEEAPEEFGTWMRQRTRWLKGWIQTMLVHNRRPGRLMTELGELQFLSLQALLGGLVLAALVHPWFWLLIVYEMLEDQFFGFPEALIAQTFWGLAALNLLVGYSVAMLLGVAAALRRRHFWLLGQVLLLPLYWLAMSLAAYRASYQLVFDPYLWEKTPHSSRSRRGIALPSEQGKPGKGLL